jgi:hypothetical protein
MGARHGSSVTHFRRGHSLITLLYVVALSVLWFSVASPGSGVVAGPWLVLLSGGSGGLVATVRLRKNLVHFSICACHPCAGAMLIFSESFQFYRMIPEGNPHAIARTQDLIPSELVLETTTSSLGVGRT